MYILGLTLAFLTGICLIKRISLQFSLTETFGFAFPLGMSVITLFMMLADWTSIPLTPATNLTISLLLFIATAASLYPQRSQLLSSFKPNFSFRWVNLVWILCFCLIAYGEYANLVKTFYYPTYDRDSMAGFDTIGYILSQEHTYKGLSIFDPEYMPKIHQAGSYITYMPMLQLAYSYVYSLGMATSKAIPALIYLSFLLGFYGVLKRTTCPTAAILATLGMMFSPEMFSFSSLSNTNVMHAGIASSAIIYLCLWYRSGRKSLLILGSTLLAINVWFRSEGIVFILAALVLVLLRSWRNKAYSPLLFPTLSLLPLIIFTIYAQTNGLTAQSIIINHPFWDEQKFNYLLNGANFLLITSPYYGWTFKILIISFVLNLPNTIRQRDHLPTLMCMFLAIVFYFSILYQIDYIWDTIDHVLNFSAKRFLFCFVPITWYYIVANRFMRRTLLRLELLLAPPSNLFHNGKPSNSTH